MTYSKPYDVLFMSHCEDKDLKGAGCMNAGALATEMGLGGIANEVEDIIIMRDIMLAKMTGVRLHIQHLSTASGLELVREAKAKGLPVTCEVTPHHLFLTEDAVRGYNTDAKVAPPLRTAADNEALINGLKVFDQIAVMTDGGPGFATETIVYLLYKSGFGEGRQGYGTAVGVVLLFIILILNNIQSAILRKREVQL